MAILSALVQWPSSVWQAVTGYGRRMGQSMASSVGVHLRPVWPAEAHLPRLRQYEHHRNLYMGDQRDYFLSHNFKQDNPARPYIAVNLLGGVTDILATRAYGEPISAEVDADDEATQAYIDAFFQEVNFPTLAYDQCVAGLRNGDRCWKVTYDAERQSVGTQILCPSLVFPEWDALDGRRLVAANIEQVIYADKAEKVPLLWRERHEFRGGESWVVNQLFRLDYNGEGAHRTFYLDEREEVAVDYAEATAGLLPEVATGIDALLVVFQQSPTLYSPALLSLQGAYNELATLKSHLFYRQLPSVYAGPPPDNIAQEGMNVDLNKMKYFVVEDGATMPVSLLEWSAAGFAEADEHLKQLLQGFAFTAGVDVSALVPDEAQGAASGTALLRQQMKTQGTVKGLQRRDEGALTEVLSVACKLGERWPVAWAESAPAGITAGQVRVVFQDGLPPDREGDVREHVQLVAAEIESRQDASRALFGGSDEEAAARVALAQSERRAQLPPSPFAGTAFGAVTPGAEE